MCGFCVCCMRLCVIVSCSASVAFDLLALCLDDFTEKGILPPTLSPARPFSYIFIPVCSSAASTLFQSCAE